VSSVMLFTARRLRCFLRFPVQSYLVISSFINSSHLNLTSLFPYSLITIILGSHKLTPPLLAAASIATVPASDPVIELHKRPDEELAVAHQRERCGTLTVWNRKNHLPVSQRWKIVKFRAPLTLLPISQ
jgi:hypothetical protein